MCNLYRELEIFVAFDFSLNVRLYYVLLGKSNVVSGSTLTQAMYCCKIIFIF